MAIVSQDNFNEPASGLLLGDSLGDANRLITNERSRLAKLLGKIIILLTVISFLFVGIFINILQVILILTCKLNSDSPRWRRWHKRISSLLVYILFSPPICLLYYWSNVSLRIQLDDLGLIELSKGPMMAIVVPNHSYELDYMVCFVLADQLAGVGCFKSMSKAELKYLPIIGWSMWMADIIFVQRNWQLDREIISHKLDALFDYDQTILGIFAEGTRYTEEKHRQSRDFAEARQLEPFKYHLVPRARGFNYTVRHYLKKIVHEHRANLDQFKILNLQIVMPDRPKFRDFIEGRQLRADVYCEEVSLSEDIRAEVLESADEDCCPKLSQLLMDIFRRKDQIVEDYLAAGGQFKQSSKNAGLFPFRKRWLTFCIWLAGLCLTYGTLGCLAGVYLADSYLFWTLLITFIVGCIQMLKRIARESKVPATSKSSCPSGQLEDSGVQSKLKLV